MHECLSEATRCIAEVRSHVRHARAQACSHKGACVPTMRFSDHVQLMDQLREISLARLSKLSARRFDEPGDLGMHSSLLKKSDL